MPLPRQVGGIHRTDLTSGQSGMNQHTSQDLTRANFTATAGGCTIGTTSKTAPRSTACNCQPVVRDCYTVVAPGGSKPPYNSAVAEASVALGPVRLQGHNQRFFTKKGEQR